MLIASVIAVSCAILLDRTRLPAGALVGALVGSLIASALGFDPLVFPSWVFPTLSGALGISLAARFSQQLRRQLSAALFTAIFAAVVMVATGATVGWAVWATMGWSPSTSAFVAFPGGLEQMAVFAASFGGDVFVVTTAQLTRWLLVVLSYPIIMVGTTRARQRRAATNAHPPTAVADVSATSDPWSARNTLCVAVGIVAAFVGHRLALPAGPLLLGFFAAASFQSVFGSAPLPLPGRLIRLLLGALGLVLGAQVDAGSLASSPHLLAFALVMTLVLVAMSLLSAVVLRQLTGLPMAVCVLALAPAGMIEMTAVAERLDLDPVIVLVAHVARTVSVILMAPVLYLLAFGG